MKMFFALFISSALCFSNLLDSQKQISAQNVETISHSFFVAGPDFTGILGERGEILWDADRKGARDGFVLENGNILIAWQEFILEYDENRVVIFRYDLDTVNSEIGTVLRLDNGNTMLTELGSVPRILELSPHGEIVLEIPLQPETDNFHMQTRMARKLPNGNYLVPHLLAFAVKEYNVQGVVVNTFRTDMEELGGKESENWPFTAIRLSNGNTLINLTHGNKTIEVDSNGIVVWRVGNEDLDGEPFVDPCGAQRLANGNTVIASYGAKGGVKLFEITREKELVWTYEGPFRVHHFQILTTSGRKLDGPTLK